MKGAVVAELFNAVRLRCWESWSNLDLLARIEAMVGFHIDDGVAGTTCLLQVGDNPARE
jgi:hypothetical protein